MIFDNGDEVVDRFGTSVAILDTDDKSRKLEGGSRVSATLDALGDDASDEVAIGRGIGEGPFIKNRRSHIVNVECDIIFAQMYRFAWGQ